MKKHIMIVLLLVVFVIPFSSGVSLAILTPVADGFYHSYYFCECDYCWGGTDIELGIEVNYDVGGGGGGDMFCEYGYGAGATKIGIMEFNLLSIGAFLTNSQIQEAKLSLTVKGGDLPAEKCLSLYNIQDANENGVIEEVDIDTDDFIGEICEDLQPGDIITFDVTAAIGHDLYDPAQTIFSGFVIDRGSHRFGIGYWRGDSIEFYDHKNLKHAPRISVSPSLCLVTAIYGDSSKETQLIRSLRDKVLSKTQEGRELIKLYYQWSPAVVRAMEEDEEIKQEVKDMIDGVLPMLSH